MGCLRARSTAPCHHRASIRVRLGGVWVGVVMPEKYALVPDLKLPNLKKALPASQELRAGPGRGGGSHQPSARAGGALRSRIASAMHSSRYDAGSELYVRGSSSDAAASGVMPIPSAGRTRCAISETNEGL